MILTWFEIVNFSENLDAIALKKLVNFVNDLMERYFSFVQRRIQLEVWCLAIVQLIRWYIVHSVDLLSLGHFHDFVKLLFVSVRQETTLSWWDLWTDSIVACRPWTSSYLTQISLGKEKLELKLRQGGIWITIYVLGLRVIIITVWRCGWIYNIILNELLIVLALAHTCTKMVLISDYCLINTVYPVWSLLNSDVVLIDNYVKHSMKGDSAKLWIHLAW